MVAKCIGQATKARETLTGKVKEELHLILKQISQQIHVLKVTTSATETSKNSPCHKEILYSHE